MKNNVLTLDENVKLAVARVVPEEVTVVTSHIPTTDKRKAGKVIVEIKVFELIDKKGNNE